MDERRHLSALQRGLSALNLLNGAGRLTVADLAEAIKVPKPAARRILETLVAAGYAAHDDLAAQVYRPTAQVRRLSFAFYRDGVVAETARPLLKQLCRRLLMPIGLTTPVGTEMVIQVSMDDESPAALAAHSEGTAVPITRGPAGHIYLAHCSCDLRRRLIDLVQAQSSAPASRLYSPDLPGADYLDGVRRQGYALQAGLGPHMVEGIIAVPVYFHGDYAASLHMRFLKSVMSPDLVVQRYLDALTGVSAAIGERLAQMALTRPELFEQIIALHA